MRFAKVPLIFTSAWLVASAPAKGQAWKAWPSQLTWRSRNPASERDLTRVMWKDPQIGSVEMRPSPGLKVGQFMVSVKVGKESMRVEALEERKGPLHLNLGGLPWPPGTTMIGDPNQPMLERHETRDWILYRATWATTRQGYTPSGILILAWHKPSQTWRAWGCEGDSVELVSNTPMRLTFKASGFVNPGEGYRAWTQEVSLNARGDRVILIPMKAHLSDIQH